MKALVLIAAALAVLVIAGTAASALTPLAVSQSAGVVTISGCGYAKNKEYLVTVYPEGTANNMDEYVIANKGGCISATYASLAAGDYFVGAQKVLGNGLRQLLAYANFTVS